MKMAHIPLFVLAGVLALASPAAAQRQETERVDRTASIRAGGQLRIKNFSGTVTITGSRRADVGIHAIRRAPRERLDNIKLEVRETSAGVTIEANRKSDGWRDRDNNVVDTQLDIEVPADVTLDVEVFSSDVKVVDVTGRQRLHTFSGNVDVTGASGSVEAETFSGDIELTLPQHAGADIRFNSFSGGIRTDLPITLLSKSKRDVRATLNGGGSDVRVKTFSGDVRLRSS